MIFIWFYLIAFILLSNFRVNGVVKFKPSLFAEVDKIPKISAKEAHCVHWSRNNECIINPQVLWSQCLTDCIMTSKDDNIKCFWWSDTGECTANPRYIQVHCPESCGFAIAWNPWVRKNLSIENHETTNTLIVEQCRLPKDIYGAANIMRRRLTQYLNGHHQTEGFTNKYYDQFYTMLGMAEAFLYTLRIYETIFFYYGVNETLTAVNLQRINAVYSAIATENTDLLMRKVYSWLQLIEEAHLEVGYLMANVTANETMNAASVQSHRKFAIGAVKAPKISAADVARFSDSPLTSVLDSDNLQLNECGELHSHSPSLGFIPVYLSSEGSNSGLLFGSGSVSAYYNELQEAYQNLYDVYDELNLAGYSPTKRDFNSDVIGNNVFTLETSVTLSNGVVMPVLGFGIFNLEGQQLIDSVLSAIEVGYRLIDSHNSSDEVSLGIAIQTAIEKNLVSREDLFIVSKLKCHEPLGFENTTSTIQRQLAALNVSYIDLYLLDSPPDDPQMESVVWEAIEEAYRKGWVRSIGVSNYFLLPLTELLQRAKIKPMVIQNKFDVYHAGKTIDIYGEYVMEVAAYYGLVLMGHSPLSGFPFFMKPVDDPIVRHIAAHHSFTASVNSSSGSSGSSVSYVGGEQFMFGEFNYSSLTSSTAKKITTPAQVLLRWSLQHRIVTLTQSTRRSRQIENYSSLRMNPLSKQEMKLLNSLQHLVSSPLSVPIVL